MTGPLTPGKGASHEKGREGGGGGGKLTDIGVATMVVASRSQPFDEHLSSQAASASEACFMTMGARVSSNILGMAGFMTASAPMSEAGMSSLNSSWRFSHRNCMRTACLAVLVVPLPLVVATVVVVVVVSAVVMVGREGKENLGGVRGKSGWGGGAVKQVYVAERAMFACRQ